MERQRQLSSWFDFCSFGYYIWILMNFIRENCFNLIVLVTKFSGIELVWSQLKNALLNKKCQDYFSVPLVWGGQEEVGLTKKFSEICHRFNLCGANVCLTKIRCFRNFEYNVLGYFQDYHLTFLNNGRLVKLTIL